MNRVQLLNEFIAHAPIGTDASLLKKLVAIVPSGGLDGGFRLNVINILGELTMESDLAGTVAELEYAREENPLETPIVLNISSVGGEVFIAQAIIAKINELRREGRRVVGHVAGYALSAAFDILQACDHRSCEPYALLMTHEEQLLNESQMSSSKMGSLADISHKMERIAFETWAARTGRPPEYYAKQTRNREWWLTPTEALGEGLIDEILVAPPLPQQLATTPMRPARASRRGETNADDEAD